jgi:hypothetical protein
MDELAYFYAIDFDRRPNQQVGFRYLLIYLVPTSSPIPATTK